MSILTNGPVDSASFSNAASMWRVVHTIGEPAVSGFKIVRVSENLSSQCVDTLSRAWSIKKKIVNPKAEGDAYPGTFIISQDVIKREETQDFQLTQTLTNVSSTIDSATWHMDEVIVDPQHPVTTLIRRSEFFNPESVDTYFPAQTAKTIINPKFDCGTYLGTFEVKSTVGKEERDGTVTVTQTLIQPWSDSRTDSSIRNPFGISHLGVEQKHFQYVDYTASSLPVNPVVASGFKFIDAKTEMDAAGFLRKTVVHEKAAPSNVVTLGIPATSDTLTISAVGTQAASLNNAGRELVIVADRIDPLKGPSVVANWANNTSDYKCIEINTHDNQDGSGGASKKMFRFNKSAASFISKGCDSSAGRIPTMCRTWPYIEDTKADVLMGGKALLKWKWVNDTFAGGVARRTIHFGTGLSTIEQESQKFSYSAHSPGLWPNYTDSWVDYRPQWRRIRVNGNEVDQIRIFKINHFAFQTTSRTLAYAFARNDCGVVSPNMAGRNPIYPTHKPEDHSTGTNARFRALVAFESVGPWYVADSWYADVGSLT